MPPGLRRAEPNRRYSDGTTNKADQGRGDQPAEDHDGHRVQRPRSPGRRRERERQERRAPSPARSSGSGRPARARRAGRARGPKASPSSARAAGSALISETLLRAAMPSTAEEARSASRVETSPPSASAAEHAAGERRAARSRTPAPPAASCRTPPAGGGRSPIAAAIPSAISWPVGCLLRRPSTSAWYSSGKAMPWSASSMSLDDRADAAAVDVAADVDVARDGLALDDVRVRADADIGDVAEPDLAAVGRVDQQVGDAGQAAAESPACPRPPPRRPSAPRRGCRPRCPTSSVAAARRTSPGLIAVLLRLREIDLDLERRLVGRQLTRGSTTPSIPATACRDLVRLRLRARPGPRRRPERRGRSCRPASAPPRPARPDRSTPRRDARVAVDDLLDRGDRLVVVRRRDRG